MNKMTIFNDDADFMEAMGLDEAQSALEVKAKIEKYYSGILGQGISDVVLNTFCQSSLTPTKIFDFRADILERKEERGKPVDYLTGTPLSSLAAVKTAYSFGFEPISYIIEFLGKNGIRPWISFRMNDCHHANEETAWLRSGFFYEAWENDWFIGPEKYGTYFGRCFDYGVKEVRDKMLQYISEQVLRYDVYGFELDFLREMYCFDFLENPECYLIMNQFMEEVKKIALQAEKKHGHVIKVLVRVPRDLRTAKVYGFDVVTWAKNQCIDIVSPCARFITSDTGMPIEEWVSALEPYGVEVCAGIERKLLFEYNNSVETLRGQVAQFQAQGSTRPYLFNYLLNRPGSYNELQLQKLWEIPQKYRDSGSGERRHILTFQDDMLGAVSQPWHPLPKGFVIATDVDIYTDSPKGDEKVILYVGMRPYGMPLDVWVNGYRAKPLSTNQGAFILEEKGEWNEREIRAYEVIPEALQQGFKQHIHFAVPAHGEITYLEIRIMEGE